MNILLNKYLQLLLQVKNYYITVCIHVRICMYVYVEHVFDDFMYVFVGYTLAKGQQLRSFN